MLGTREAAGRQQVVAVLSRVIASYQRNGKNAASGAGQGRRRRGAGANRRRDGGRPSAARVHESVWRPPDGAFKLGPEAVRLSETADVARHDEVHSRASWIVALGRMLKSPVGGIRRGPWRS